VSPASLVHRENKRATASHPVTLRAQSGFSIVEILIGFFILSLTFVSLGAYTSSQRTGLFKSNQLSDGTQVAVSSLEEMKRQLSDSATFKKFYDYASAGAYPTTQKRTVNAVPYTVTVTILRGPPADYILKLRSRVTWKGSHSVEFGVLVPGATNGL
jgi:type II secretory pathway pseudopilin PulG